MTATNKSSESAKADFHRIFEPLHEEHDYVVDEIEGALPEGLVGTMYRNGPGEREVGGAPLAHFLEGNGMITSLRFDGKNAHYRNRYVRTPYFEQSRKNRGMTYRTAGTLIPGGPEANVGREIAQEANTNVMRAGGHLLALYGGAMPYDIDPDTLETRGLWDADGVLGPDRPGFSAHPKIDPRTGEFFNFSTTPLPKPMVHMYSIGPDGRGRRLASAEAPFAHWVHDFAITERNFVFALSPFQFNLERIMKGEASPTGSLELKRELGSVFLIMPRDGGKPRILQHDAFAYFHVTNAYEDGDDIVLDLSEFSVPFERANQAMFEFRTGNMDYFANIPVRYRISKSGKITREQQADFLSDWPQLDWRYVGVKNRYSYHSTVTSETGAGGLGKIDHQTGRVTQHLLPDGHITGEASFVPASRTAAEDDGWLIFMAYEPRLHRSRVVVLDARNVEADPVASVWLRHHQPFQFHGSFVGP
jgi:all-trans-8'-apo-beta-carotenal 15,15'-oxygenase